MAADPIGRHGARARGSPPRVVFRYVLLACLFMAVVFFQVGSTRTILHRVPLHIPLFLPATASAALEYVDSKATAAGLHKGDILVAINGRPYTGTAVLWEGRLKAAPGSTLAVTVRSPGADSQDRTVRIPVARDNRWLVAKTVVILDVVMPAFCIALGFWVVLVRPGDLSAWLLLGMLLSFTQFFAGEPPVESWGPGMLRFAMGYRVVLNVAWFIFMFLFGFFFPEPLPFFRRPGAWRKWVPWIVIAPWAICGLGLSAVAVVEITSYSAAQPLYRVLRPLDLATNLYPLCLSHEQNGSHRPDAVRRVTHGPLNSDPHRRLAPPAVPKSCSGKCGVPDATVGAEGFPVVTSP